MLLMQLHACKLSSMLLHAVVLLHHAHIACPPLRRLASTPDARLPCPVCAAGGYEQAVNCTLTHPLWVRC